MFELQKRHRQKNHHNKQQSFESIEAKHMQNAWKPVKGYLHKKGTHDLVCNKIFHNTCIPFKSIQFAEWFLHYTCNPSHIWTSPPFQAAGLFAFHSPG